MIPESISRLYAQVLNDLTFLTPLLGEAQFLAVKAGLLATLSLYIWGPSKNLLLFVKSSSLRLTGNGCAVITKRSNVQKVISTVVSFYKQLTDDYAQEGKFPLAGPVEIRASHLDKPGVVQNGESPAFSTISPINNYPEFDVAVWFDFLGFHNAPHLNESLAKIESFMFSTFDGTECIVRSEWSKGWAFTDRLSEIVLLGAIQLCIGNLYQRPLPKMNGMRLFLCCLNMTPMEYLRMHF